ncbi:MAG: DUF58 domain-containing protein [Actinomycetaceae bacterium]|nr:DUF58 domain-containing protein [Actinomycetaceae bacterium]
MFITRVTVGLAVLGVLVGVLTGDAGAVAGFHAFLALLVGIDALLAVSTKTIAVSREANTTVRSGQRLDITLTLTNMGRRRARGIIRDAWPPSTGLEPTRHPFNIPSGERRVVRAAAIPTRRGTRYSEAVTIRTFGPLQLAGRQRSYPTEWMLRVLPEFSARKHLPSRIMRLRELDGRSLLLVRGQGTEFDSLREYVAGDDVRAIDWRSTARLGNTVVRTWRPERDRHVIIVLDSGRSGALRVDDSPAFDAYIESALLLSTLAIRAGDRVSVVALDAEVRARISGDNSTFMHRLAQALADVEPQLVATNWVTISREVERLTKTPALVVVLSAVGTGTIESGMLDVIPSLTRTHRVLVGTAVGNADDDLSAPGTVEHAFESAALARSEVETRAIIREVERSGAIVVHTGAQDLPPKIADTYIELKARGKL